MDDNQRLLIGQAFENRELLKVDNVRSAVLETLTALDDGSVRVAEYDLTSESWKVNDWVKKAILLYFALRPMEQMDVGPFHFHDKIPLKTLSQMKGVRVVPGAVVRFGSHVSSGAILMPSFVNIGAYVGEGTMVDTWATVGSCAQVGARVHLSGGVGIGGVLEPPQAAPVIIEDDAFLGSRCIVVEGVRIGTAAVLGANVVLTSSTRIIDVSSSEAKEYKGYVPPRSVVIPGSRPKKFPGGEYHVPVALIVGERKESTDKKTTLNEALRDFGVSV
ncbi:MAG: 2,3,4,5-tetrahydropyridine-2,6-dicarboxylate N-succinyltransferase [Bdellovibrionota bacterium]